MDHIESAATVLELARRGSKHVTTAESCTGGLLAAAITAIAGSSEVFERGYVTYSNAAKTDMLKVSEQTLQRFGAVSEQVASEMAQGALQQSGADIAISITGIAGPGPSEHKPEGRVCFALAQPGQRTHSETVDFSERGRPIIRNLSVDHALKMLIRTLS